MNPTAPLVRLAAEFRRRAAELSRCPVVAGFDGFVDEIISVVGERRGLGDWTPVKDILTFGGLIQGAAGRSSLREIVVHRMDPGGCAVNLGDGLLALGLPVDCFATLGQPRHSAFDDFAGRCRSCHSWGRQPGRTLAFEFEDGKLMFSAVTQLAEFDVSLLERVLRDGVYSTACAQARLIALTDWTLYPHMTSCWRKLQTDVYQKLGSQRPCFFLDLVDPSSRSADDVRAMLETLSGFESAGPTTLGLNGTEANVVARALGLPAAADVPEAVRDQAVLLRDRLGIREVAIHCVKHAAVASPDGAETVEGPYCTNPRKSTGAGDRFNAGYCAGLLLGLGAADRLRLGNAASGFFVRHARSASPGDLADFLSAWARNAQDSGAA